MISQNVALVYHFFAHYRRPVLDELLSNSEHRFQLCADTRNALSPGIEVWTPGRDHPFRECRCFAIRGHLVWQSGLLKLALERDLDAIIYLGDWKWPSTWLSAAVARLSGKRVLFWTHGWRGHDRGIVRLLRKLFYRLAHGLLLYGNWARQVGIAEGFAQRDLYVVYNSVATLAEIAPIDASGERCRELRRALFPGRPAETPVVCCSSRLGTLRRLDLLLDAAAQLESDGHPVDVLLIGDGPERGRLEAQAERLGVSAAFVGACYDERRIAEYFAASNVTVSPGDVGLTAIHSMLHGVPVISHPNRNTQGPEAEAIVPGDTGDFYREGDRADLARQIRNWTRTPFVDPRVSRACRDLAQRHYAPEVQRRVIDAAVAGEDADAVVAKIALDDSRGADALAAHEPIANGGV